jgi:hypothetical protein
LIRMKCEHKDSKALDIVKSNYIGEPAFAQEIREYRRCNVCKAIFMISDLRGLGGGKIYSGPDRLRQMKRSLDDAKEALEGIAAGRRYCRFCGAKNEYFKHICPKCKKDLG